MINLSSKTKNIIITGIKDAGKAVLKHKGKADYFTKSKDFDYGVPADILAENIILEAIKKTGLNCEIISEESGQVGSQKSNIKVYLDPLDGTVNFSRGIPSFAIGLAIYGKQKPLLGIIYDPSADELFIAEKNKGISLNGKQIKPQYNTKQILINLEWFGAPGYEEIVRKLKKHKIRARTAGSGVLALCYGMIGRGDATILIKNRPWDIAPGMVIASELGYVIKQLNGNMIDFNKDRINIIAAPKPLFNKLFRIING